MINKFDGLDWILSNGQRPFRYNIEFKFPNILQNKFGLLANKGLNFLCKEAKLPDIRINQNQVGVFGRTINIPSVREFKNTTQLTFYIDENSFSRRLFEYWCLICDSSANSKEQEPKKAGTGNFPLGTSSLLNSSSLTSYTYESYSKKDYTKGELSDLKIKTMENFYGSFKLMAENYSGNIVYSYEFFNVYPLTTNTSNFSDDATDRIVEFTLDLSFTSFTYDGNYKLGILQNLGI